VWSSGKVAAAAGAAALLLLGSGLGCLPAWLALQSSTETLTNLIGQKLR